MVTPGPPGVAPSIESGPRAINKLSHMRYPTLADADPGFTLRTSTGPESTRCGGLRRQRTGILVRWLLPPTATAKTDDIRPSSRNYGRRANEVSYEVNVRY